MLQGRFQEVGDGAGYPQISQIARIPSPADPLLESGPWELATPPVDVGKPPQKHALARRAGVGHAAPMKALFTYWQEADGRFLGYLNDYPEHWTQGEDLEDLKEQLRDLFAIFTGPT